ncbi:hypothetical protein PMI11_04267 [Rhizobium sp. CF142]|nr:hypothetical protein PMI11_04267 [Rhizobium sp. CF142]
MVQLTIVTGASAIAWHAMPVADIEQRLNVDPE